MNASEMNHQNRDTRSDNQSVSENSHNRNLVAFQAKYSDPEIISLSSATGLPVDQFEMQLLPDALQPWAMDMQYRLQCPPDYIGVSIMVGLATVVGNKVTVQPKAV